MQEIITYLIIAATVVYVLYKIVSMFITKKSVSGCSTTGCSGCNHSKEFAIKSKHINIGNKKLLAVVAAFFLINFTNIQAQDTIKESAIEFGTTITGDFARNLSGGIEQENAYLGNIDITASFSTEKAGLWKGGTFFVYFLNNHGTSISQYIGDFQGIDNIEANANSRLYQFWYMQEFNRFSITLGQHDLNSEFCASEYGGSFINSSFGIQPDISANVPVSIFPVASLGAILRYNITNNSTIIAAIYNGNPGDQETNPNSLDMNLNKSEGTMNMFEYQYYREKDGTMFGSYKLGVWSHSIDNHYGMYFIADQKLYSEGEDKNQGLGIFTQLGATPNEDSFIQSFASVGLHYTGLFKGRDEDNLGIAIGNAFIADSYIGDDPTHNYSKETVIELTYKAKINSFLTIQPDLQYVINPGGASTIDNSLSGIIRVVAEF